MESSEVLEYRYEFDFENGVKKSYSLRIDSEEVRSLIETAENSASWTDLESHKCEHCPLSNEEHPKCPVAVKLEHLVEHFKDTKSMWRGTVKVTSENRHYTKETDLQTGLFGIFGLIMATSGCPYMELMKPMARFHLPFATVEETMVRSTSMYMLRQYFIAKDGGTPDYEMKELEKTYENLNKVNYGIIHRIRSIGKGDSESNAVMILDCFAQLLSMEINNDLKGLRALVF